MVKRKQIITILLIATTSAICACSQKNNYDVVCGAFKTLENHPRLEEMDHLQRDAYIMEQIKPQIATDSGAFAAWNVIRYASSHQRYELFVSAAKAEGKEDWQCSAMQKLAATTGQFD